MGWEGRLGEKASVWFSSVYFPCGVRTLEKSVINALVPWGTGSFPRLFRS